MNSFVPIEQTKLEDINNINPNKYSSMKYFIKNNINQEKITKPILYKHLFINKNSTFINQNNDKRKIFQLSLMEFIKKNCKHKNELIIGPKNIKNNYFINPNINLLFTEMAKKLPKKIIDNYFNQNNNYFNITNRNIKNEISMEGKNVVIGEQNKNSSFNNDFCNNKNKIKEKKKIFFKKRVKSTIDRNRLNNNEIFGKNQLEEKDSIIDYESAMNKDELIDNNIVYIRKKNNNKNINKNDNNNILYSNIEKFEENKNRKENNTNEKNINENNTKNHLIKKNQSLPDINININNEKKEKSHNKIKSSYIPSDINKRINNQRNEIFFKDSINYINEKNKKTKKVIEYIYDNNFNAEFHFQSIKFGLENPKKNKYQIYGIYTDNENKEKEKEEVIVKAFEKQLFLNNELMNNNNIKNIKSNSIRNKYGYYKTSLGRKSTEENKNNISNKKSNNNNKDDLNEKNNSRNNTNKKDETNKFYRTKYDKFDIKKSILFINKGKKNDNDKNDSKRDILNKHKKKCKDTFYNTTNGFFDFKNNRITNKTPLIINRYNIKRKKNNNDDIIGLI